MHRPFPGLLLAVLLLAPTAWTKDEKDEPLFKAPEFRFSQVDTICVAPTIDVRPNDTQPLLLSGPNRSVGWRDALLAGLLGGIAVPHQTADAALARIFKNIGYKTVSCNPVTAKLTDLKGQDDAWLSKLDFGESRWLFILAVEAVNTAKSSALQPVRGGYAVVSGYLFDKQASGDRLAWRDRVVGRDYDKSGLGYGYIGSNSKVKQAESEGAIADGAERLLATFETKNKRIRKDMVHTASFAVTCNLVWTALNDTLGTSENYTVIEIDNSDMMAIYATGHGKDNPTARIGYAVLKGKDNSCEMQIVETLNTASSYRPNDADNLKKRVQASLSK